MNCDLPTTGIDIWPFVGIGLLLLLGGIIAVGFARRRKAPIIGALAIALLAIGSLTLAPSQSAQAAGGGCPVANPDTNTVTVNVAPNPVTGNVLTNDTDTAGFALDVTNPGASIAMTYGTLTLNADGTYSYDLDNGNATVSALQAGDPSLTDVYNYTIADTHGGTSASTLTITINGSNHPPVANPDTNQIDADASPDTVNGNVLTNDTDPDGDTLTVTSYDSNLAYGSITIAADGTYTYTLNESDPDVINEPLGSDLTDQLTYSISDGHGGTASSTLTITIHGTEEPIG